jgi:hypothetical protein
VIEDSEDIRVSWTPDQVLSAMADLEDRTLRSSRMLSRRIERLEKSRGGSDFSEIGEQVTGIVTSVLIAYGLYLVLRAFACAGQQQ